MNEESFYCQESKSCIPKSWTCDGAVQCIYGEDEDFELCRNTFPERATFKCLEGNRTNLFNVTIFAVPCDGIIGKRFIFINRYDTMYDFHDFGLTRK